MTEWEATPQLGVPGHCSLAQVFKNGRSVASFDATYDPEEASNMARLFVEAMLLHDAKHNPEITSDDLIEAAGLIK